MHSGGRQHLLSSYADSLFDRRGLEFLSLYYIMHSGCIGNTFSHLLVARCQAASHSGARNF